MVRAWTGRFVNATVSVHAKRVYATVVLQFLYVVVVVYPRVPRVRYRLFTRRRLDAGTRQVEIAKRAGVTLRVVERAVVHGLDAAAGNRSLSRIPFGAG